jgi:hypothetical protein
MWEDLLEEERRSRIGFLSWVKGVVLRLKWHLSTSLLLLKGISLLSSSIRLSMISIKQSSLPPSLNCLARFLIIGP